MSAAYWARLANAVTSTVGGVHQREPEMPGIEQKRLQRMAAPQLAPDAFAELLAELLAAGGLIRRGAFLALPGHRAELGRDERVMWERIKPMLLDERLQPPRVRDIARDAAIAEGTVRALLRKVALVGEVALVAHDHFFLTEAVAELADLAGSVAGADGVVRAASFRDAIGSGRKLAIQILEFFDRVGYTRRVRDDHVLRGGNPWRGAERQAA
jgi:selenocysteine-specific elongation factor